MPDLLTNLYWEKTNDSLEKLKMIYSGSRSHATKRLWGGRTIHSLEIENLPAQRATTKPLERMNLRMLSFLNNMFYCSGQSSILQPNEVKPARKTNTCSRRGGLNIKLPHPGCVDFMFPGASQHTRAQIELNGNPFFKSRLLVSLGFCDTNVSVVGSANNYLIYHCWTYASAPDQKLLFHQYSPPPLSIHSNNCATTMQSLQ